MKKILVAILIISLVCLGGCSLFADEYKDSVHYDITNYKHIEYRYYRTQDVENYAVSLINCNDDSYCSGEGLLYQVGKNDYILLDSIKGDSQGADIEYEDYTQFYKDKLYIIRGANNVKEYILNKENTKVNELKFDFSHILDKYYDGKLRVELLIWQIDKVNDDYIYFKRAELHYENSFQSSIDVKCSLKDYVCEEYEYKV